MNTLDSGETHSIIELIHRFQRTFVISRAFGQPAEGKIPFSPLNFHVVSLVSAKGSLRPTQICNVLGCPKTTLSTALLSLEKKGLINRTADPKDGRAMQISLTQKGLEVADAIRRHERMIAHSVMQALPDTDTDQVLDACKKLVVALETMQEQHGKQKSGKLA